MATHVRITGLLTNLGARTDGTSPEGRAWARQALTILVGGVSTTEVTFDPSRLDVEVLKNFQLYQPIDLLADAGVFNNRLSLRLVSLWDDDRAQAIDELVAAGASGVNAA